MAMRLESEARVECGSASSAYVSSHLHMSALSGWKSDELIRQALKVSKAE